MVLIISKLWRYSGGSPEGAACGRAFVVGGVNALRARSEVLLEVVFVCD